MSRPVILSQAASADLRAIGLWIAEQAGDDVAFAYVQRIEDRCFSLADFARPGSLRRDIGRQVRCLSFEGKILILYRATTTITTILRIVHGSRDLRSLPLR